MNRISLWAERTHRIHFNIPVYHHFSACDVKHPKAIRSICTVQLPIACDSAFSALHHYQWCRPVINGQFIYTAIHVNGNIITIFYRNILNPTWNIATITAITQQCYGGSFPSCRFYGIVPVIIIGFYFFSLYFYLRLSVCRKGQTCDIGISTFLFCHKIIGALILCVSAQGYCCACILYDCRCHISRIFNLRSIGNRRFAFYIVYGRADCIQCQPGIDGCSTLRACFCTQDNLLRF